MKRACVLLLTLLVLCAPGSGGADEPPRRPQPPGRTLLNAGVATFVSAYATAYVAGILFVSFDLQARQDGGSGLDDSTRRGSLGVGGGMLLIPVLGPFLSAATYREPAWSIPWAIIDGGAQVAGLAMMIAGGRIAARSRRLQGRQGLQGLQVLPYGGAGASGVVLSGQF